MNKTISITLSGLIFHIEEDAYKQLKNYLDAIREHFLKSSGGAEIMDDIEASIAEKFSEKVSKTKQVITKQEVEDLISVMGSVDDFKEEGEKNDLKDDEKADHKKESKEDADDEYQVAKKLYRDTEDVVFAGVCSGIAAYFGIDPVIVRLLFVFGIFFGGAGFYAYVILWIAMPEAKTSTQKLEMRGKKVTIKKIEKVIKEKIEPQVKNSGSGIKKVISFPFVVLASIVRALKSFFKIISPILKVLVGVAIVFVSFCVIFSLVFASAVLVFNIDSPYIISDIPINDIVSSVPYALGIFSGALTIIIPFIFLMLLGLAVMTKRKVFNAFVSLFLLVAWMFSIVAFGVAAIDAAPQIENKVKEIKEIETVSRTYDMEVFDSVDIDLPYKVNINQGDELSVEMVGREEDIDRLKIVNSDNVLEMSLDRSKRKGFCLFCFDWPLTVNITAPDIEKIKSSNKSYVMVNDFVEDELEIISKRNSKVELNSSFDSLKSNLDGYSYLYLNKPVKKIESILSRHSKLIITDVVPESIKVDAEVYSKIVLNVKDFDLATSSQAVKAELILNEFSQFISSGVIFQNLKLDATRYSKAEIDSLVFHREPKSNLIIDLSDYSKFIGNEMNIDRIDIDCDKRSFLELNGEANTLLGKFDGYSDLRAFELKTQQAGLEANDYSELEIFVELALDAKTDNYSSLTYKGNPKIKSDVRNNSKIKKYGGEVIESNLIEFDNIGDFSQELERTISDDISEESSSLE